MNARRLVVAVVLAGLVWPVMLRAAEPQGEGVAKPSPAAVAQWRKQLVEWRKEFFGMDGDDLHAQWQAGRERVAAIDDPAAIPAIVALLKTEKHPQFRRALIQPLIKLGGKEAVDCLVKWSVEDENPLLREEAAKGLIGKEGLEAHLDTYIAYLKSPEYVSNAAEALRWTKLSQPLSTVEKPNERLVKALVNAIHTFQYKMTRYRVAYDTGTRPHVTRTGNIGPWRQSGIDEGVVRVKVPVPQPAVVAALKEYSGQDFQYDESKWNAWLTEHSARR
jgi:hypothetical protein